jgi:hypothetical protein
VQRNEGESADALAPYGLFDPVGLIGQGDVANVDRPGVGILRPPWRMAAQSRLVCIRQSTIRHELHDALLIEQEDGGAASQGLDDRVQTRSQDLCARASAVKGVGQAI